MHPVAELANIGVHQKLLKRLGSTMSRKPKVVLVLLGVTVLGTFVVSSVLAQSSSRGTPPAAKAPFHQRLWKYLETVCYDQWSPAGDNGGFQESEAPHGALVKTYMNRTAAGSPKKLPVGSMIIKENYSPDEKLMAITLMYRLKDYNPEAGNWYWVKYDAKGKVAEMETPKGKMAIAGKAMGCIECHSGADGDDFAFFND